MIVKMRYAISPRAMIPMMRFSIGIGWLDFFAARDEREHQGKEADGGQGVEDVGHGMFEVKDVIPCPG